ncbi:MAG: sigma-70 family RNA polymerase sigma factor [Phycisphaeraceae bacterium]|nr:MAG: sigma-70 family RNA polymerase sigma factor [Phycisphaeraceae bacterium]
MPILRGEQFENRGIGSGPGASRVMNPECLNPKEGSERNESQMKTSLTTTRSPLDQVRRRRQVSVKRTGASTRPRRAFNSDDERLLQHLLVNEQDYIDNEIFRTPDAERMIYDEAPDIQKPDTSWYHPVMDDLNAPRERSDKSSQVLLTAAEERVLFLQFNYARHRVSELQKEIWASPDRTPTDDQAWEMLRWSRLAERLREQIANTNLALVLAMAKRTRMSEVDFADLVSEGNMALLRAVDKFDCARGFKFSTYACRAILKAFSRQGMKLSKHRQRFPTDFDPKLERSNFLETRRGELEKDTAEEVRRIVDENRAELTDIERTIIEHRFGLETQEYSERPMTLEQIGQIIGVTKERVRQIQNKALEKIRVELEETYLGSQQSAQAERQLHEITGFGLN